MKPFYSRAFNIFESTTLQFQTLSSLLFISSASYILCTTSNTYKNLSSKDKEMETNIIYYFECINYDIHVFFDDICIPSA